MQNEKALSPNTSQSVALPDKVMEKGLRIFEAAFPSQKLTKDRVAVWAQMLNDLTPEQFARGITRFCRDHPEIYPGTNVVAHIRQYGLGTQRRDHRSDAVLVFNCMKFGRGIPDGVDVDAAHEAWEMTKRAATGLVADEQWDERRFVDLYVGLVGTK